MIESGITLAVAVAGCAGRREPEPVPAPAPLTALERRAVGCYQLVIGPWHTLDGRPSGGAGDFTTPPAAVELDSLSTGFFGDGWYRTVRPALGAPASMHRMNAWTTWPGPRTPEGPDSVAITFSTGFSGVRIVAAVYDDSLVGRANDFWDFTDPGQEARAIGYRVPCRQGPAPAR